MSEEIQKNIPSSTLIFVKRDVKFTDKESIWGSTYGNFIGISKIAKEVVWHELYHKIGLGHCDNNNCVMNWETKTTSLCSNCKPTLRKALTEWKTAF